MTVRIPVRRLTRGQRQKLQRSKSFADLAEELVAEEWGLGGLGLDPDWWDVGDPDGAKYQCKSTSSTIGDRYPGRGRFRVWQSQNRSLSASDAQGQAWYAFVLLDEDAAELLIRRMKPKTVTAIVQERGGWNDSGHEMGRQHKLPYSAVIYR